MLALTAATAAALAAGGRVMMEPGATVGTAPNWDRVERCSTGSVDALFMMKLSPARAARLEETFWAVSTPENPRYGEHLNRDQLAELVGASDESLSMVTGWLKENGIKATTETTRDSIRAKVPCDVAERLFATEFHTFRHRTHSRIALVRAGKQYSLPAEIAEHVEMVGNIIALPKVDGATLIKEETGPNVRDFPAGSDCGGKCGKTFVTPEVLKAAYNLGDAPTSAKGSIAIAEFQGVMYDDQDLDAWGTACGVNASVDHQVGDNKPTRCRIPGIGTELCAEAMLDIYCVKGVSGAIPLTDIYSASFSLLNWMTQVNGMSSPPLVHSVSYGNDEVQQTSTEFMLKCNQEFMKSGTVGISVLFASGDQGVLGRSGKGSRYHPDFPAGSPYITSVGGTNFKEKSVIGEETTWPQGGGGFSDTFAIPSFQADAVAQYKKTAGDELPEQSYWNNTGRGYPDVSALGGQVNPYCIRAGSVFAGVAGTSAACPVVSAVFAKLNEVRLAAGKKALGFLNPFIYGLKGQGFNDVTSGRNCGSTTCVGKKGFPAVSGWDAATGWGTPNFAKLKTLV